MLWIPDGSMTTQNHNRLRRLVAFCAVLCAALCLAVWITSSILTSGRGQRPEQGASASIEAGRNSTPFGGRPADVPVALLADYYEHITEHTPPRDPSGSMQRREHFYVAPHDPFDLMRAASGTSQADAELRTKLDTWEKGFRAGKNDSDIIDDMAWLAERSSLSPETLLDVGRAFNFLLGDKVAAAFFDVALDKAQEKYKSTQAGDPSAQPLLHALDQTKALWTLHDFIGLEKRFVLATALYPQLSVESRRSGCLYATAVYYQNRPDDAAAAIFNVWDKDKQAGDLGVLEKSDIAEMNWLTGGYLFSARRFNEAIPYYQAFLATDDDRKPRAARFLSICLTQVGRAKDAETVRQEYGLAADTPSMPGPARTAATQSGSR